MAFKIKNATSLLFIFVFLIPQTAGIPDGTSTAGGHWVQLQSSIGISAMHMQVMRDNKVIIFDRTDFGPSNISLSGGRCRFNPRDIALKIDCTAHSVLYDVTTNTIRPLTMQSDAWCSSAAVAPDGTLIQTGGFNDGYNKLRTFTPCPENNLCDWVELHQNLTSSRWYASNQILPDGRIIIVGGRSSFTYEFVPKNDYLLNDKSFYYLRFLRVTRDPNPGEENNLYPFLHLLPDGNLFIFANRRSVLFDYNHNRVVREYPIIPGEEKRNYPSTGSSVLLPMNLTGLGNGTRLPDAEVMVCGGAFPGAFNLANKKKVFLEASRSCGRLRVTDPEPQWVMEVMPTPRVMPDMILLPTGDVLILNGAANGTAGWENAANPVLYPVIYKPGLSDPLLRFQLLAPGNTPRMYHSSAVLLPDGRVLVGGSNPHRVYDFLAYPYPTELSLDAYYPDYMGPEFLTLRPSIIAIEAANNTASYGGTFSVTFSLQVYHPIPGISVTLVAPSFTTHSFAMNQRMLMLEVTAVEVVAPFAYKVTARGPLSLAVAPPGYYMLYIVHAGIPSVAVWVQVK
ncbi:aldehyde oxidase GLOX [Gastrolobium bilobum]|uniref:aldehyde oxidase GLOX n=1 Tax=Gastrolobium bilobum TaxID=150636 RepID=UPI002AB15AD9|nr:aldehyde oxidase GLOX [Gastrolobium bilobum]